MLPRIWQRALLYYQHAGSEAGRIFIYKGERLCCFGGTNEDDERLGAVDASITYIYDIGQQSVYDLAITVENNGVYETTHTFIKIDPGEPGKMRRINNFFTSTGYLPTDIWIKRYLQILQFISIMNL